MAWYGVSNGGFKEGVTKMIDLSADSLPLVVRMMKYFYVFDYEGLKEDDLSDDVTNRANHEANNDATDDGRAQFKDDEASLRLHAQMYSMGDKYAIDCLRDQAALNFKDVCDRLGVSYTDKDLPKFEIFLDLVPIVYEIPQPESAKRLNYSLRYHLAKAITGIISAHQSLLTSKHLEDICLQNAEFAYHALQIGMSFTYHSGDSD
ncbi:MAG: hypothetical protein Q9200_003730 [Gallowayella weberi]